MIFLGCSFAAQRIYIHIYFVVVVSTALSLLSFKLCLIANIFFFHFFFFVFFGFANISFYFILFSFACQLAPVDL